METMAITTTPAATSEALRSSHAEAAMKAIANAAIAHMGPLLARHVIAVIPSNLLQSGSCFLRGTGALLLVEGAGRTKQNAVHYKPSVLLR